LSTYHFLDGKAEATSTLGDQEALVFKSDGYCDGPGCGDPYIAYATKNGTDFYNVVMYGDKELDTTEQDIVASFKFVH